MIDHAANADAANRDGANDDRANAGHGNDDDEPAPSASRQS